LVAVTAIGLYGAFRDQIRSGVDRALGLDELGEATSLAEDGASARDENAASPFSTPQILLLLIALARLRHDDGAAPAGSDEAVERDPAQAPVSLPTAA
jgi:hypothetical protein